MLNLKFNNSSAQTLIPLHNPFPSPLPNYVAPSFSMPHTYSLSKRTKLGKRRPVKAVLSSTTEKSTTVTAVVTVLQTVGGALTHLGLSRGLDDITDIFGRTLLLELVAADLHPSKKLTMKYI